MLISKVEKFLKSQKALKLLSEECGSKQIAKESLNIILKSLKSVLSSKPPQLKRWLIILPNNHSLVGIQPLVIALLHQLKITVRLPQKFYERSLIRSFLDHFFPQAKIYDATFRIQPQLKLNSYDGILVYGSDATIARIKKICKIPVVGHGEIIMMSKINSHEIDHPKTWRKIFWDAFSLSQKGCLNLRALIIESEKPLKLDLKKIVSYFPTLTFNKNYLEPLATYDEKIRMKYLFGDKIEFSHSFPLISVLNAQKMRLSMNLFSQRSFYLPIYIVSHKQLGSKTIYGRLK